LFKEPSVEYIAEIEAKKTSIFGFPLVEVNTRWKDLFENRLDTKQKNCLRFGGISQTAEALEQALEYFKTHAFAHGVLIFVSDGLNTSKADPVEVANQMKSIGITIVCLCVEREHSTWQGLMEKCASPMNDQFEMWVNERNLKELQPKPDLLLFTIKNEDQLRRTLGATFSKTDLGVSAILERLTEKVEDLTAAVIDTPVQVRCT